MYFKMLLLTLGFLLISWTLALDSPSHPPVCPSEIYCYGPLLHTVQMSCIFNDSKTFVDMKMRRNSSIILREFDSLMNRTDSNPSTNEIISFIKANFEPACSEFELWNPEDWKEAPLFLERINDQCLKDWAASLNSLWKFLGRKMKNDVKVNPELYSIIYVPNPFIIPGGRFREFYYWDSFWIIKGLLLSEMFDTVKGMLANFLSIVERYGMIPNGGRLYYTRRSQPPLFIPMFQSYIEVTDDYYFLEKSIHILEKEFMFWVKNHSINVQKDGISYRLGIYRDDSWGPRPEAYKEDVNSAKWMNTEEEKNNLYSELKTATESGWDFSSRWFINTNGSARGNLTNTKIRHIVPVDLNAILYWNAKILSDFYEKLNNTEKCKEYYDIATEWMISIEKVLWDDEGGSWLDYDLLNNVKRDYFFASNLAPLWTGSYDQTKKDYFISGILKYLEKSNSTSNMGGIPTSLFNSGEQWDYPNAWPPIQYMVIIGLEMTGDQRAKQVAYNCTKKWVKSNYEAYKENKAMFEKYDATVTGGIGSGGEYELQLGFGWTNGVIMELLNMFGDRLSFDNLELLHSC